MMQDSVLSARLSAWLRRCPGAGVVRGTRLHCDTPAVLFVDNRFPRFVEQLEPFFANGVLDATQTTLLCRDYWSSRTGIMQFARRWKLPVVRFKTLRSIPDLSEHVVFYPFNGIFNLRLLRNDRSSHVFLTHGESNKPATVHRLLRLYDLVLAPGAIAMDRYVQFGVLSRLEAAERVLAVGTALTASITPEARSMGDTTRSGQSSLLYMPTWEGGIDAEWYTSADHPATGQALRALCERLSLKRIVVRPHPNLGARIPAVRVAMASLVASLRADGFDVVWTGTSTSLANQATNSDHFAYAAVDVSAGEAMAAACGIRSVVFVRHGMPVYAPPLYLDCRARAMLALDESSDIGRVVSYVTTSQELDDYARYRRRVFTVDERWTGPVSGSSRFERLLGLARERQRTKQLHPLRLGS